MRQALEALDGLSEPYDVLKAQNALRAAIEQSEKQEPVAWMYDFLADDRDEVIQNWVTQSQDDIKRENGFNVRPLYTAPRQWVGLTNKDIIEMWPETSTVGWDDIRLIEAKLKEKNT